jgi:hypothetical protein
MRRWTLGLAALAAVAVALAAWPRSESRTGPLVVDCTRTEAQWSRTEPPVNLTHVFCGEIDRDGDPSGYHHRPAGEDPPSARVVAVLDPPNAHGVYTAEVRVRRPGGAWTRQSKFSSFFPDAMSREAVLAAILEAYRASGDRDGKWGAEGDGGFRIEGWLLPDPPARINTAYPIYVETDR